MLIAAGVGRKVAINVLYLSPVTRQENKPRKRDLSCAEYSNQLIHAPGIGAGNTRVGPAASALQRIPAVYNALASD